MSETVRAETERTRVLVVEDELAMCVLISDLLEGEGYVVRCCNNDTAAYDALRAERFDALVVDINLGRGTTGFDVARRARRHDPEVGVVYVTGGPPESVAVHGVHGAVLVRKPFGREDMLLALEETGAVPDQSGANGSAAPLE